MNPDEIIAKAVASGATFTPDGKVIGASKLAPEVRQAIIENKSQVWAAVQHPKYQRYFARPVTQAATSGLAKVLGGMGSPWGFAPQRAQAIARPVAETVVPQTPTQAGIDAASAAAGLATGGAAPLLEGGAGLATRLAAPAIAGGIGSKLGGGTFGSGALSGALQSAGGELISGATKVAGRYSSKALDRMMTSDVGQWIANKIPALGKLTSPIDFDRAFRSNAGLTKVAKEELKPVEDKARQIAGNHLIDMPSLHSALTNVGTYRITFDDATDAIKRLDDASSWTMADPTSARLVAKQNRKIASAARADLAKGLNQISPGLGDQYFAARAKFAQARMLRDLFKSSKQIFPRKGGIDWPTVKELVDNAGPEGYRDDLERAFGADGIEGLLTVLGRGTRTTAGDVPAELGPGISAGMHYPRLHFRPQLGQRIGNVPRRFPPLPAAVPVITAGQLANDIVNGANR